LENKSNYEDDRYASMEGQLAQAKQIAGEADRKYEEVGKFVKSFFFLYAPHPIFKSHLCLCTLIMSVFAWLA